MERLHPNLSTVATCALIALALGLSGCRSSSSGVAGSPFMSPDRVSPPNTRAIAPGQAQPYYQGDPLPAMQSGVDQSAPGMAAVPREEETHSANGRTLTWSQPGAANPAAVATVAAVAAPPIPVEPHVASAPAPTASAPAKAVASGAEFWETWAAEKATRTPSKEAPAANEGSDETTQAHGGKAKAAVAEAKPDKADAKPTRGRGKNESKHEAKAEHKEDKKQSKPEAEKAKPDGRSARGKAKTDSKAEAKPEPRTEKKASKGEGDKGSKAPAKAPASASGSVKLYVNLGKKHGMTADQLRTLLAKPLGGDRSAFGSVMLRDDSAHVKVDDSAATAIIKQLAGTKHHGEVIAIERVG